MDVKLLYNFKLLLDGKEITDQALIIENGRIKEVLPTVTILKTFSGKTFDFQNDYLVPGFVDLHVNGGNSHFFTKDLSVEAFDTIYLEHVKRGNTSILPTVISTTFENTLKAVEVTRESMRGKEGGMLGLHLEGPYINTLQKGVHKLDYIRPRVMMKLMNYSG